MFVFNQYYSQGDVILNEGEKGDRIFKVISGEILICRGKKADDYTPIGKVGPGELFGEMYLWDQDGRRFASAIATKDTILEVIYDTELTPDMYGQICSELIKKVRSTSLNYIYSSKQFTSLQSHNGEENPEFANARNKQKSALNCQSKFQRLAPNSIALKTEC